MSILDVLKENNIVLVNDSHPNIMAELKRTDSFENNWPTVHERAFFMNTDFSSVWANPIEKREWWNFSLGQISIMEDMLGAHWDSAAYTWTIKKDRLKESFGIEV